MSFMLVSTLWTRTQKRLSAIPPKSTIIWIYIYLIGENEDLSSICRRQHRTFLTSQWKIWKMKLCIPPCLGTSSTKIQLGVQKQCCDTGPKTFGLHVLPLILPCYVFDVLGSSKYDLALFSSSSANVSFLLAIPEILFPFNISRSWKYQTFSWAF